jgi:hypothetical protein
VCGNQSEVRAKGNTLLLELPDEVSKLSNEGDINLSILMTLH